MSRFLLMLVCVGALAGCAGFRPAPHPLNVPEGLDPMDATPHTYDYEPSTFSKVGNAVLSVPETAVWWPYKIVGSALRGGYDGVVGGVDRAPVPVVGVIASPLTAAAGVVNGTVKGVTRGPAYIGSTSEFGSSLGKPWTEEIPLW